MHDQAFSHFEGLLNWAWVLQGTPCLEEGGRLDWSQAEKVRDLCTFREAMALIGWSTSSVSACPVHSCPTTYGFGTIRPPSSIFLVLESHIATDYQE